jgi:hypothetical protein
MNPLEILRGLWTTLKSAFEPRLRTSILRLSVRCGSASKGGMS